MSAEVHLNGTSIIVAAAPDDGLIDVVMRDTDSDKLMSMTPSLARRLAGMLIDTAREVQS